MTPRHTAIDCARALGQTHLPTPEQIAVIEAPLEPMLVVAGAGSGKTETMAARVVWLVANGLVEPDEVLGLTFTRKAAGELAERLSSRLAGLRQAGLWTPEAGGAEALGQLPVVSTYHSYAGRIVREHGARVGVEADTRLLTEAAAWQFSHEAVTSYDGPMPTVLKAESTVTTAVVDLAGEMAEHLVTVDQVDEHLSAVIDALGSLVKADGSRRRTLPKEIRDVIAQLTERREILPILRAYADLKAERDSMDFADQMAVAAVLAQRFPEVGVEERRRFKVVLLDEFQDTSEAQLELLRQLFAPDGSTFPVTAVGDPHQSIYGWRGASSTTLAQFRTDFGGEQPAAVLPLSTSWRNDARILTTANAIAAPLRDAAAVPVLPLGPRPDVGRGQVSIARYATLEDEAAGVVDWVVERRRRPERTTAAVLCRKRSQFESVIAALEERGVPHEVVGLGGLLHTPEVADLVALLWVVQDPSRGDHLMRLLTGTRCRLGAADLDALGAWSAHLGEVARRDLERSRDRRQPAGEEPAARDVVLADPRDAVVADPLDAEGDDVNDVAAGEGASTDERPVRDLESESADRIGLIEALDDLPGPSWRGPDGEWLSAAALTRLAGLRDVIRHLRTRTGLALADLVSEAEAALGLEIEVLARPGWGVGSARAHLDAFQDVASGFDAAADRPTLGGFLSWLDAAVDEERGLDLGWIETREDAVQVMTVHAAKGLEWDVVAVPGLVEATFPAHSGATSKVIGDAWGHTPPSDKAWLGGLAGVPHDLRGDRDGLPRFAWDRLVDWDDGAAAHAEFLAASGERGIAEERRLAYVALTRARTDLLLSAHVWGTAKTPRVTSRFLAEVRDLGLADRTLAWVDLPPVDAPADNPRLAEDVVVPWPPPMPEVDSWLSEGAAAVRSLVDDPVPAADEERTEDAAADGAVLTPGTPESAGLRGQGAHTTAREDLPWGAEWALLQAERRSARAGAAGVVLPAHVTTSDLVALAGDASAFASALRRPMPQPPAHASRMGTTFHSWIEGHYSRASMLEPDELPGATDDEATEATLRTLRDNFLASEWAGRTPVELEVAVETMLAGVSVRGRIDAVFRDPADPEGYVVVDWKSGPPPAAAAAAHRALQLASYRLAWCRLRDVDPARVRAAFFHAATGETVWPDLAGESDLEALLRAIPGA